MRIRILRAKMTQKLKKKKKSVSDPDPDWIWIQSGQWICILVIETLDPDSLELLDPDSLNPDPQHCK